MNATLLELLTTEYRNIYTGGMATREYLFNIYCRAYSRGVHDLEFKTWYEKQGWELND